MEEPQHPSPLLPDESCVLKDLPWRHSLSLIPSWTAGREPALPVRPKGPGRGAGAETTWSEGRKRVVAQRKPTQGGISAREAGRTHTTTPGTSAARPEPPAREPATVARAPTPAFSLRTRTVGRERKICFLPGPTCFTFHYRFRPGTGKQRLCPSSRGWTGRGLPAALLLLTTLGKHILLAKPGSGELPAPSSHSRARRGRSGPGDGAGDPQQASRLLGDGDQMGSVLDAVGGGWLNWLHACLCSPESTSTPSIAQLVYPSQGLRAPVPNFPK